MYRDRFPEPGLTPSVVFSRSNLAVLEDLDSETVETATDERILAFNQEVIRCYKDAAGNVTDKGLGYESMACW